MRDRPVLIYDGDCAFCQSSVDLLKRIGPGADIVAWQLTDLNELGVTEAQAASAIQWVTAGAGIRTGHEAAAAALVSAGGIWGFAGRFMLLPGISWIAAKSYRLVAENRHRLPGGTPACQIKQ
ncbi:MAG: thiol-disulfide oxidoreductase DCC family protein [Solirubrobacterales bacterium]